MGRTGGNFLEALEQHIEKIVLAIVALVCIWLLLSRVIVSPNVISYNDRKFSPGDIDNYILNNQVKSLNAKLNRQPEAREAYKTQIESFIARIDSSINIDSNLIVPLPAYSSGQISDGRVYNLPLIAQADDSGDGFIGEVKDVVAEHIRAVAYVPTENIDEEKTYDKVDHKPDDLDLVTVQATFDVAPLAKNLYESFAGVDVREQWRDPCLAKPIFAAVQLQRQQLLADGSWSEWQTVPREAIDHHKKLFDVVEEVGDLPAGGMEVRLLKYHNMQVQVDLLQPRTYQIASAKEQWFPPMLHKKYVRRQKEEDMQKMLEAKSKAKKAETNERQERMDRSRTSERPRSEAITNIEDIYRMYSSGGSSRKSSARRNRPDERRSRERSTRRRDREVTTRSRAKPPTSMVSQTSELESDMYGKLDEILITKETNFAKMTKPLTFWAHDDTVEPGKSYRYRIRLGIFNPIAGTNQFTEQYKSQKNKVVLWSRFSDETEVVKIPAMLYFFPIQDSAKAVTVQVSRYILGYWYSKNFTVRQGEVIGKVVKTEAVKNDEQVLRKDKQKVAIPKTIDYSTGAVMVDIRAVNDWSGGTNLRQRYYSDMLYSFDGTDIQHMPIKQSYWPAELQAKFSEIRKSKNETKEPLREWGDKRTQRKRGLKKQGEEMGEYEEYIRTILEQSY